MRIPKMKTLFCLLLPFILISASASAADYRISGDFDQIEGAPNGVHTVRLFSLSREVTRVTLERGSAGTTSAVNETLAPLCARDFNVKSGDAIRTDQPVVALEYSGDRLWSLSPVPGAQGISWDNGGYLLIGALEDGTEIRVTDSSGSQRAEVLRGGSGTICSATRGTVSITANKPIQVYGNLPAPLLQRGYLLLPNSDAYVPLGALVPQGNPPAGDLHASGQPMTLKDRVLNWVGAAIDFLLGGSSAYAASTSESLSDNGDGTYTFTQRIDRYSTPPHYTGPWSYSQIGFGNYNWYNQDWGWQHTFPYFNQPNIQILSGILTVRAWDVDAETWHGYDGEYDGISGDGAWLNPQYLQGTDSSWSVTNFDVDTGALSDGVLNVWMDIDMHHNMEYWATTLDYSLLTVKFTYTNNNSPYAPQVTISPVGCTYDNDNLTVNIVGPTPADPDGDPVTYQYRWLVDPGTGNFIDDEFAGRGNTTGNVLPASATHNNDRWRVEVIPVDSHGAKGTKAVVTFATIGQCNTPPIADAGQDRKICPGSTALSGKDSRDPDGTITSYRWDLYQGSTWVLIGVGQDITYDFNTKGTYQVRLTVTDNYGATDDATVYLTVDDSVCGFSNLRLIDTIASQDVAFILASASKVPYSVTSDAAGNTVVEWRYGSFRTDETEAISFDLNLAKLVPGENRLVDHKLEVIYTDRNGKEVSYALPPLYVNVLNSSFDGSIGTDKPIYDPNQDALITASVKYLGQYSRTVDARIVVEDTAGTALKEELYPSVTFAAGAQKSLTATFNTGTSYAGDYRAHLVLTENGKAVGESFAPFKIAPATGVHSGIVTDKPAYGADEPVAIDSLVHSTSLNYTMRDLTARITLYDPAGNGLFTDEKPITTLLQGQTTALKSSWNTASNPKGKYRVLLEVTDASGQLSTSSTAFDIVGTAATGTGVSGTINAQPSAVTQGQEEGIAYTVTNSGNEDLSSLPLTIVVADAVTLAVKQTYPVTVALPMGATVAQSLNAPTAELTPGPYLALLKAALPGSSQPKTLASANFQVVVAPKPALEATKTVAGDGNVLVWLNYPWTSGQNCPDKTLITRALDDAGVLYRIVTDKKDFETQLHNQVYTDFLILGDQLPIEDHISELLREQVYQGKGVAASLFTRLNLDQPVLGIKAIGQLPGSAYSATLLATALTAGETFGTSGRVIKAEALDTGEVAGWVGEQTSREPARYPAALVRRYGHGNVVYFAFDLGMSTQNYDAFALLLANTLHHIHQAGGAAALRPGEVVPVELAVQNRSGNLAVRIAESYPASVHLYAQPLSQPIADNPWITTLSLLPDQKETIRYWAQLPEEKGSYVLESSISYAVEGVWKDFGSYRLELSVASDAVDTVDTLAVDLGNLHPLTAQERADVAIALDSLQKVPQQATYTTTQLESIIHELLKAVDAIIDIQTVNVEQARKDLDTLLAIYAAKWYRMQ